MANGLERILQLREFKRIAFPDLSVCWIEAFGPNILHVQLGESTLATLVDGKEVYRHDFAPESCTEEIDGCKVDSEGRVYVPLDTGVVVVENGAELVRTNLNGKIEQLVVGPGDTMYAVVDSHLVNLQRGREVARVDICTGAQGNPDIEDVVAGRDGVTYAAVNAVTLATITRDGTVSHRVVESPCSITSLAFCDPGILYVFGGPYVTIFKDGHEPQQFQYADQGEGRQLTWHGQDIFIRAEDDDGNDIIVHFRNGEVVGKHAFTEGIFDSVVADDGRLYVGLGDDEIAVVDDGRLLGITRLREQGTTIADRSVYGLDVSTGTDPVVYVPLADELRFLKGRWFTLVPDGLDMRGERRGI